MSYESGGGFGGGGSGGDWGGGGGRYGGQGGEIARDTAQAFPLHSQPAQASGVGANVCRFSQPVQALRGGRSVVARLEFVISRTVTCIGLVGFGRLGPSP